MRSSNSSCIEQVYPKRDFHSLWRSAHPVTETIGNRTATIGRLSGDVFMKVITDWGIFRKANAWGIQKSVFDRMVKEGLRSLRLFHRDNGKEYSISVEQFLAHCFKLALGKQGKQYFCPLQYFTVAQAATHAESQKARDLVYGG